MIDVLRALGGKKTCPWCKARAGKNSNDETLYERLIVNHRPHWMIFIRYDSWVGRVGSSWCWNRHRDESDPDKAKWLARPKIGDRVEDCRGEIHTVMSYGEDNDDWLNFEDGHSASWMNCCDYPESESE